MTYVHGRRVAALVLAAALFLGGVFPGSAAPGAQKAKVSAGSADQSQATASFDPVPVPATKVMINKDSEERANGSLGGEWMPPMPAGAGARGVSPVWRLISARLKMKDTKPDRGIKFRSSTGAKPEFLSAAAPTRIGIFLHRTGTDADYKESAEFSIDPGSENGPSVVLMHRDGSRWTLKQTVDDELKFPIPFWVVCKAACDQDVDKLLSELPTRVLKNNAPVTASAPPASGSDKKQAAADKTATPPQTLAITVTLLDDKGFRLQSPATKVRLSPGACDRRPTPQEQKTNQNGEVRFERVWDAQPSFCVEIGDGAAARCFPIAAGIQYLTIYESMLPRATECPSQTETFKVVVNLFRRSRPAELDTAQTVALSDLKVRSLTFQDIPAQNNNMRIDTSNTAAPSYNDVKIEPAGYYTQRREPVLDRTGRTLTLYLDQDFVSLTDLKIEPVNSAGGLEPDCRLSIQVEPDVRKLPSSEWSGLKKDEGVSLDVIKDPGASSYRYALPPAVSNRRLPIEWPVVRADLESPVTIKSLSPTCVVRENEKKLPRSAFLGTPYRIQVRESKPGFALIATRVDRGDLDFLGMTPSLETSFWTDVFAMADELDHDPNSDRTRFEWSKISQWQSGTLADKETFILQPTSSGALLFGPAQARQGMITQSVDKLTTEPSASVVLKPVDLVYHLNSAVMKMPTARAPAKRRRI